MEFIYLVLPDQLNSANVFLCGNHFTEDCFTNRGQFELGYAKKLILIDSAVPTLRDNVTRSTSEEEPATSSFWRYTGNHCQTDTPKHASTAIQCTWVPKMVSVGTQLSWGTLREFRFRSKGTQTPTNISAETEMSSSYRLPPTRTESGLTRKRPRYESMEEWAPIDEDDASLESTGDQHTSFKLLDKPQNTGAPHVSTEDLQISVEESPGFSNTKYIVFESCLRQLFNSCPVCSMPCDVKGHRLGTFVAFRQHCPHCNYSRDWTSQPLVGTMPLGNLQMSAATYFTGLSFFQVEKLCKTMQLQCFHHDTFRRHARNYLEPVILHKWKVDQQQIFNQLRQRGKIKVGGDMWADSPGYGSYTLTHLESNTIIDLQLVQSNEVGCVHMEKEGLKRSLDYLNSNNLPMDCIVTDSCPQIQEFLRERNITQFYHTWLFEEGLSKKIEILSRNKDCTVLKKWLCSIKNHIYWSATSSASGPEKVAKWTSLINHMQNVHKHESSLYPKCTHPDIISRDSPKWLQPGSYVLNQVEKILNNKQVLGVVTKLSHNLQTSSRKVFHSLIQDFTPKNVVFPFTGMLCRLYLAAMHHNENTVLSQITSEGLPVFKESCSESKKGEFRVKTEPTYNYLDELMGLVLEALQDPAPFLEEMKTIPIPQKKL